ncbi:MAG: hypothetical protein Q9182_003097 [Xanthomendoza sp. 2 TL-2023]
MASATTLKEVRSPIVGFKTRILTDTPGCNRQLTIAEQEDEEFRQALAMSASHTLPTQESGTTLADKKYFGPVRNEYHDTKNWIMTISKATAKEIILNPEPQDRRRQPNTPAFLRPTPAGHRLPGLMKILHAIPAAREALLSRQCIRSNYGSNNEWWDGVPIEYPQILRGDGSDEVSDKEILYEPQRLMAFLDDTQRAYGSGEALAAHPDLIRHEEDPVIKEFLEQWTSAAASVDSGNLTSDLFYSIGIRSNDEIDGREEINILELDINEQLFEPGQSLYDTIDSIFWPAWDGTDANGELYLDKVADVLVIRATRGDDVNEGLDIKVPSVWYADRYSESAQPQVRRMMAAKTAIQSQIRDLDARKTRASKFENFKYSGDVAVLLDRTKQYFKRTIQFCEDAKGAESTVPRSEMKGYNNVLDELTRVSERVAEKIQEMEESKQKAQAMLREVSKLLTLPCEIPEESPHDRYTLRGVCAEPHTVYVQERARVELEDNLIDLEPDNWQWWKLEYEKSRAQTQVSCTKVREIEVLQAVRTESPSAILVYASDRAMAVEKRELPPQLRSFVQTDNHFFAAELTSFSPEPTPPRNNPNADVPPSVRPSYFHPPPEDYRAGAPSNTESDFLPSYNDHRTFSPSARDKLNYDDFIPASLQHSSTDLMDVDEGVEMMERDGERLTAASLGAGSGRAYRLGAYEPEIVMDEREDEVQERAKEA